MYFYELLQKCDESVLTDEFIKLCADSPDPEHTKKAFCGFLEDLKKLKPETDDCAHLHFDKIEGIDGKPYDDVSALFEDKPEKYSLIAIPWNEVLGYRADEICTGEYGREYAAALVLWEMTWLGYDERSVRERLAEWDKR